MGEHDQKVLHDEDAHGSIHDDGRRFRPLGIDESPDLDNVAFSDAQLTPVFRYSGDKLISDAIYVHRRPFHETNWESLYSSLFGTGVKPTRWEDGVEPSFTPIIDESYRVVGHLGWINSSQICIFTAQGGTALDLEKAEKARLAKERQQLQSRHDAIDRSPFFRRPAQSATNSPPPRQPPPCRPSPTSPLLKPAFDWGTVGRAPQIWESEEERHQNNFNFFLAAGGTAFVGRAVAMDLWDNERHEMYWIEGYRCLVLVAPDGHLQGVLGVEKVHYEHESRNQRDLRLVLKVVDIALTIWMVIDIVTIPVALFRLGTLVAEKASIWAIELAANEAAKAALKLAEQEAKRALELAAREAAEAAAKAAEKAAKEFAVETVVIDAKTEARWAARGNRLRVPESGGGSKSVGELWREGGAEAEGFSGRSGAKGPQAPRTDLTQPPRHVMKPEPIEDLNKGIPNHLKDASPAEKRKWIESPEGKKWRETKRLDGPSNNLDTQPPHAGPRDHDAEANMFERLKATTNRDTVGEFHFKVDRPVCPACKDMILRFAKERPRIKVIQHSLDNKLIAP